MARTYWIDEVGAAGYDLAGFMRDVYGGLEYANPLDNDLLDRQYSTVSGGNASELWDESGDEVGFYDIASVNTDEYLRAVTSEVSGYADEVGAFGKVHVLNKQSDCWPGASLKTVPVLLLGRTFANPKGGTYYKNGKQVPLPSYVKPGESVKICWQKRGTSHSGIFKAATKNPVVKGTAKITGDVVATANSVVRLPGKAIKATLGKIPIIGTPISAIVDLSPEQAIGGLSTRIIRGERIDKAFLRTAKDQIKAAKTIAPYVQTVMSVVPGVGTGISAAIGAGVALAEGRTITDAVLSSVKGALPGGAASQIAFDTGVALAKGERIDKAALNAVKGQLPPAARRAADIGIQLAGGANVGQTAINELSKELPPAAAEALKTGIKAATNPKEREAIIKQAVMRGIQDKLPKQAQEGLDIGIAMATGRNIQSAVINKVASKAGAENVYRFGSKVFDRSKTAQKRSKGLSPPRLTGYKAGLGVVSARGMTSHAVAALRQRLPAPQRAGFDHALKTAVNESTADLTSLVKDGKVLRGNWRKVANGTPGSVEGRLIKGNRIVKGSFTRAPAMTKGDWAKLAKLTPVQQANLKKLAQAQALAKLTPKQKADLRRLAAARRG